MVKPNSGGLRSVLYDPLSLVREQWGEGRWRRRLIRLVFALLFLALFSWMTWEAFLGYGAENPSAASFPKAILIPAVVLAAIAAFREATRKESTGPSIEIAAAPVEFELEEEVHIEPAVEIRRTLIIIGWIVGFFIGIWLIGWMITVPLAILLYTRVAGRESWRVAIALGVVGWVFFDGVFDARLHIPLSQKLDGILMSRLEDYLTSLRGVDETYAALGLPQTNKVSINGYIGDSAAVVTEWIEWLVLQIPVMVICGLAVVGFLAYNLNNSAKNVMDRVAQQTMGRIKKTG
jgi:hypothetical protein